MNIQTLLNDEAIRRIEQLGGIYEADSYFDLQDQLLICETLDTSTPVKDTPTYNKETKADGNAYEGDYGGCKCTVTTKWFTDKSDAIDKLRVCTSRTSIVQISALLDDIFLEYPPNKAGYWFDVARYYTPRVINWVIGDLIRLSSPSHDTIRNPAAYFTFLIKHRKKRRAL